MNGSDSMTLKHAVTGILLAIFLTLTSCVFYGGYGHEHHYGPEYYSGHPYHREDYNNEHDYRNDHGNYDGYGHREPEYH